MRARLVVGVSLGVLAACGLGPPPESTDGGRAVACTSELDCPLGLRCVDGACSSAQPAQTNDGAGPDGGSLCARDEDCARPLVCVRSTGQCVPPLTLDAGEVDAGPAPMCQTGDEASCGISKVGDCRLGVARCELTDAGLEYGLCEGAVYPQPERCDGHDNDCNGLADDGLPDISCGTGACARALPACTNGAPTTCVPLSPSPEVCDGLDNDCNGQVDDGIATRSCGVGACQRTTPGCTNGQVPTCTPGAPTAEVCDGVDNNCNGQVDEGIAARTCGVGACQRTAPGCSNGVVPACTPGTPTAEICDGLDNDCNGVVDNGVCTPGAVCPGAQTVNPNTTVTLTTSATVGGGRTPSCAWSVVSRPATSSGTFTNGTSCASAQYFADVVGTHVLQFTVTDSSGLTTSCTTTITVNPLGNLWVELTWSAPNDMDLHLLHPSGGAAHTASSWKVAPYDAYFANTNPLWDTASTTDDPSLDRDDIVGQGPENMRINNPSTTHGYTIGVHMYSYAASPSPVVCTVKVYCSGTLKTTQVKTFGTTSPTTKDLWVVGAVSFSSSGACTFAPDGYVVNVP